ncbi:HAMP domain-containing protein, partial [Pengzhenrongella frigida]
MANERPRSARPRSVMTAFRDVNVGGKLAIAMCVGLFALATLALVSVTSLQAAGSESDDLLRGAAASRAALGADMMHDAVHADVLKSVLPTGTGPEAARQDLVDHASTMTGALDEVASAGIAPDVDRAVAAVRPAVEEYLDLGLQITTLAGTDVEAALALYPDFQVAFKQLEEDLPSVGESLTLHGEAAEAAALVRRTSTARVLLATALAGACALTLFGWLVSRSVSGPLKRAVVVLEGLAEGRLDLRLEVDTRDEVGQMASALNRAMV